MPRLDKSLIFPKGITVRSHRMFQRYVVDTALLEGWLVYYTPDSRWSPKGITDLILAKGGAVLFWELKMPDDKLKPDQQEWKGVLEGCEGVEYGLFYPQDLDSMVRRLING